MTEIPALLGLFFLARNFFGFPTWAFGSPIADSVSSVDLRDLCIVIPARNEEQTLPMVMQSLKPAVVLGAQVLIIDDASTDRTLEVALAQKAALSELLSPSDSQRIQVLQAPEKPQGWSGKNWACHIGSEHAKANYILFTDADTQHTQMGLFEALGQIQDTDADLLTSLPFHSGSSFWEKTLSIFHVLLIQSTRPALEPKPSRLYANGQFLLFRREKYVELGGHVVVKNELCEDLMLAKRVLQSGAKLVVANRPLYQVRMYLTLNAFISGWSRNFSLGLRHTSPLATLELICLVAALFLGIRGVLELPVGWTMLAVHLAFLALCMKASRRLGKFPVWTGFFWPWALVIFFVVTVKGLLLLLPGRKISWKDRSYSQGEVT